MTAPLFDQTVDMGADGNTLLVDASQPHGFRFGVGAGGTPGLVLISKFSVQGPGTPATLTFASIPTYNNLMLTMIGQDASTTQAYLDCHIKINGDAVAANYVQTQYIQGQGGAAAAGTQAPSTAGAICGAIPGILNNGAAVGCSVIHFVGSGPTAWYRMVMEESFVVHSAAPVTIRMSRGFLWKSGSLINNLVITAGVQFAVSTAFALYGYQ